MKLETKKDLNSAREIVNREISKILKESNLKIFNEVHIMDQESYPEGFEVYYKGDIPFLDQKGYKNTPFIIVKTKEKVDIPPKGRVQGEILKRTLKSLEDGKSYTFSGNINSWHNSFSKSTGGKLPPKGEDWESLIAVAYNNKKQGKEWNRAEKFWKEYSGQAKVIARELSRILKTRTLEQTGDTTAPLRSDWGGVDNTPKTDLYGGKNERISLKKAGGSQLTSGGPKEIVATFKAAARTIGEESVPDALLNFIDNLEGKMAKLQYKGTVEKLRKIKSSGRKLTPEEENAIKQLDALDVSHVELTSQLKNFFETDILFKKIFCFEAATGTSKFRDEKPIANLLIEFDPESGTITKNLRMLSFNDASPLANNSRFYFNFKSSGGSPSTVLRTGQIPKKELSSFSLDLEGVSPEKSVKKIETLSEIVISELSKVNPKLSESIRKTVSNEKNQLNEWDALVKLFDKIKEFSPKVIDKVKSIYNKIMERVRKVLNSIKTLGKNMIEALMYFLGIEIASGETEGEINNWW